MTFEANDIPVPADYARTGSIQPAVYQPSTEQFLEKNSAGTNTVIATSPALSTATVVPVDAPLSYRIYGSAKLDPPTPAPTPTPTPTPTQTLITPTAGFATGNSITVLGTIYASSRQPWFVGTTIPGVTVDLILGGSNVIRGAKTVGVVVTNAAGDFSFQLPAGIKNGSYTMEARALSPSGSSYKLSVPLRSR